jgi:hypothetical protein
MALPRRDGGARGCDMVTGQQPQACAVRAGWAPIGGPGLLSLSLDFLSPGGTCTLSKLPFPNSKIHQILWYGRLTKRNNFTFGVKFKFQMDFKLQF